MRKPLLVATLGLFAAASLLLSGCGWNLDGDSYPDRSEVEQTIVNDVDFGNHAGRHLNAQKASCVKDSPNGQIWRCLVIYNGNDRIGVEVVAEPNGKLIVTPGWVADGEYVGTGTVSDSSD